MKKRVRQEWVEWLVSAGLVLAVAALAYLPLAGQLGYYHDDWFTLAAKVSGSSVTEMFTIDRPFMGRIYQLVYQVLGDSPLRWQLFAFAARLVGAFSLLWLARMLWPRQRLAGTLAALIFIVYPGFLQQTNASTFQNHFIGYSLAIFSVTLTVRAVLSHSWLERGVETLFAALAVLAYLRIYEYMIGMEALRVILIWFVLSKKWRGGWRRRLRTTLLYWLPYLAAMGVFLYWRFFVYKSTRYATDASVLTGRYLSQPLGELARILIEGSKDLVETVVLSWFVPFYNLVSRASYTDLAVSVGLGLAAVGLVALYIRWLNGRPAKVGETDLQEGAWVSEMFWLGLLGVVVTLLPVGLSNRDVQFSANFDRYTLQSTLGAAFLLTAGLTALLRAPLHKWLLTSMVGLALVVQYNNAAEARNFWQVQRQFWWQLTWRAPQLADQTVLVPVLPPGYRMAEDFEAWAPLNFIYNDTAGPLRITAEVLNGDTAEDILAGTIGYRDFRTIQYDKDYARVLIASQPSLGACLHILDGGLPELSRADDALVRQVAARSRPGQIDTQARGRTPPALLFGSEPDHNWCYYYQKAGLARQRGDWVETARLGDEAAQLGFAPQDISEWTPFLDAYLRTGRDAEARRVVEEMRSDPAAADLLCDGWASVPSTPERLNLRAALCAQPQ